MPVCGIAGSGDEGEMSENGRDPQQSPDVLDGALCYRRALLSFTSAHLGWLPAVL